MATKAKKKEKEFDAVAFMRKERERVSKDIDGMDYEQIKEYLAKRRRAKSKSRRK